MIQIIKYQRLRDRLEWGGMREVIEELEERRRIARLGGGEKRIEQDRHLHL